MSNCWNCTWPSIEAGGIVESLWDIYALTKEEKIKELALKLEQTLFLDDLANKKDTLTHRHGNTHIPLVLGAVRRYELTGEARYLELAKYLLGTRGGGARLGHRRHDRSGRGLGRSRQTRGHHVPDHARNLQDLQPAAAVAEAVRGNRATRATRTTTTAHTSTAFSARKVRSRASSNTTCRWPPATIAGTAIPDKSMWCCYGTGMENFSKLGDSVFFHTSDAIYINQFIPCVLDWKEKNFRLAIETKYPEEEIGEFGGEGRLRQADAADSPAVLGAAKASPSA